MGASQSHAATTLTSDLDRITTMRADQNMARMSSCALTNQDRLRAEAAKFARCAAEMRAMAAEPGLTVKAAAKYHADAANMENASWQSAREANELAGLPPPSFPTAVIHRYRQVVVPSVAEPASSFVPPLREMSAALISTPFDAVVRVPPSRWWE